MSEIPRHRNYAAPLFESQYPTPGSFLEYLRAALEPEARSDFVIDRILARLGPDSIIGGSRASGFSPEVLAKRGVTDLDIGLLCQSERLLDLEPEDRILAIDELVKRRLSADVGDHVQLEFQRIENNELGAFYRVKAKVDGVEIGRAGLDVDCKPHITAPLLHSFVSVSGVEIAGLPVSMRTYQNPADVFAEKVFALYRCAEIDDRPRYAKHLNDLRHILESDEFEPYFAAISLNEISRTTQVPISDLYPPQYLAGAGDRYRARRKKVSPGEKLPLHVMRLDFDSLRPKLKAVANDAERPERRAVTVLSDFATAMRELWLAPPVQRPAEAAPIGSYPVAPTAKLESYMKRNAIPSVGPKHGSGPSGVPHDRRPSHVSRSR